MGDLIQKNDGAEGKEPGIGDRRIGETKPPRNRPGVGDEEESEENQGQESEVGRGFRCLGQGNMGAVVIAHHGNVRARGIPVREVGAGLGVGRGALIRTGAMVMAGRLDRHVTVGPETQHKRRRIAMAQAEMAEHRKYQHKREAGSRAPKHIHWLTTIAYRPKARKWGLD
ncbi:protein of unknown function [Methylococcus capsulatus]|uniref:Uncharacterized protein n=1 Tax=Methylococcus capsulatus TaxID=414 RepID=A0AA35UL25_METCP|nr:protein of unknown function [Methylococcus capsulatus]